METPKTTIVVSRGKKLSKNYNTSETSILISRDFAVDCDITKEATQLQEEAETLLDKRMEENEPTKSGGTATDPRTTADFVPQQNPFNNQ